MTLPIKTTSVDEKSSFRLWKEQEQAFAVFDENTKTNNVPIAMRMFLIIALQQFVIQRKMPNY